MRPHTHLVRSRVADRLVARAASHVASPVAGLVALLLVGCGSSSEPPPPATGTPPAPSAAPTSAARDRPSAELAWDAPASFRKVEHPSTMRKATYRAPAAEAGAEEPELAVTVVGGSVDANVDRWVGQFDAPARETLTRSMRKVGPYDVTVVEMRGTFQGGGPMMGGPAGPRPGWALLAAVVPTGDTSWFFKMTGPEAAVSAARADFDALIESFRPAP